MSEDVKRTVLVTGAGGGMCQGINARLGEAGHRVLCVDLNLEAAETAAQRIIDAGGEAAAYAVNVADAASVKALFAAVESVGEQVDVLINAAGVLDRKYLADHDDDSFARVLDINLTGPFRMIQTFAPMMVARGWGRIVNISSIAGVNGYPYPSYAASKAGLSNMTRSLLMDFWGTGVTVNSICPGVVDTTMAIQEVRDQVPRKVPTEQIIDSKEIGGMILFLLSEDAKNINGTDLLIDGGATSIFQFFDRE